MCKRRFRVDTSEEVMDLFEFLNEDGFSDVQPNGGGWREILENKLQVTVFELEYIFRTEEDARKAEKGWLSRRYLTPIVGC